MKQTPDHLLLPHIRHALQAGEISTTGLCQEFHDREPLAAQLAEAPAFSGLEEGAQQIILDTTVRTTQFYGKKVAPLFEETTAKAQLAEEVAGDALTLMEAGWKARAAIRLTFYHVPDDIIALRDHNLEANPIWSKTRLMRYISDNITNPFEAVDLVVNAFAHTRIVERSLLWSDSDLHAALSFRALRRGDLAIRPTAKTFLEPLPPTSPSEGLQLLRETAHDGVRGKGNHSLEDYIFKTAVASPEVKERLAGHQLDALDCKKFLGLLAWYADSSGYDAVNSPHFISAITTQYLDDVAGLRAIGIRSESSLYATYHPPSFYKEVFQKRDALALPADNFNSSVLCRDPIEPFGLLERLAPIYHAVNRDLPDVSPAQCLQLAANQIDNDSLDIVTTFKDRLRQARILFGNVLPANIIQTACIVAPTTFVERLHAQKAAQELRAKRAMQEESHE